MNIRHMTLEQYKTDVVPLILELKKILRKGFLKSSGYTGLLYLTKDEYIQKEIERGRGRVSSTLNKWKLDDDYYREYATQTWERFKLKDTPIPVELYNEYKNIYNKLSPLFIDPKSVDVSKAHKDHKPEVRKAISDDVYIQELKSNEVDFTLIENVCDSLEIKVPKRLYDMKEKVEQGIYDRGYLKANMKFIESIRTYLLPYVDKLRKIKRDHIEGSMKAFEESDRKSTYDYFYKKLDNINLYNEMSVFYNTDKTRVGDVENRIQKMCIEYSDQYVNNFIFRMENKTNLINIKWGVPIITFSNTTFDSGELGSNFILSYSNGNKITGDSKVIIAGGYIQCLHQRYLLNFYYNGSKISLEQIDNL